MLITINTDHNIEGGESLSAHVSEVVEHALRHQSGHVTRVEVHLADDNSPIEMSCMMEARLEHHQPLSVSHTGSNIHQAIEGAAEKLAHVLEHTLGKLDHERQTRTDPPLG